MWYVCHHIFLNDGLHFLIDIMMRDTQVFEVDDIGSRKLYLTYFNY
jgi:hypothetical protein